MDGEGLAVGRKSVLRAVAVIGAMSIVLLTGCITNAGAFTLTVLDGSTFTVTDLSGNPTSAFVLSSTAKCNDGIDNDVDGQIDYGADPECDSASDMSERVDGVQSPPGPVSVSIDIDAAGSITADPSDFVMPQDETCVNTGTSGVWCMGVTLHGTGGVQTGSIDSESQQITLPMPMVIELDALAGFPGLDSDCHIGPINSILVADNYNLTTGEAGLAVADSAVPAISGCGGDYDTLLNSFLSLPGQADIDVLTTILNGDGDPITFSS